MNANHLLNWLPYKVVANNNDLMCYWINTFGSRYTEPFFDETISICKSKDPYYGQFQSISSINVLEEWAQHFDNVSPTAFIFHISRCGSTMVSQLLGLNDQHISLSEVPFFDDILRLPLKNSNINPLKIDELFKAAVKIYGQKRIGNERYLFIKTDSWHVFFYKQLRRFYPDVPFVFLYRSPGEVFSSHQKKRGMQAVPGLIEPTLFGFDNSATQHVQQDDYTVKMLKSYLNAYLEILDTDPKSIFIDYKQGISGMMRQIISFTNIEINDNDLEQMESRSMYHSKYPDKSFSEEFTQGQNPGLDEAFYLYIQLDEKAKFKANRG